jgi:hypothetical protein
MIPENQIQDAATVAAAAAASKVTNLGAATAVGAGFLADNWIGLAGLLVGVAGFVVKWYYEHKTFKLIEKEKEKNEHHC